MTRIAADAAEGVSAQENRRVLVIDDAESIHRDFHKVLAGREPGGELDQLENELFGRGARRSPPAFELDCARQGAEGLELLRRALGEGRPYALAFVDMWMPPGWDGLETVERLWEADPRLQIVVCTAYADQRFQELVERLAADDRLLILKKPFDQAEVAQLAGALTAKWGLSRQAELKLAHLESLVGQRTRELELANRNLLRARDEARAASRAKSDFLAQVGDEIRTPMNTVLGMTHLALLTELTPTQRAFISKTRRAADSLMGIIEDILDFSRLEGGRLALEPGRFQLQVLLERLTAPLAEKARRKGLRFSLQAPLPALSLVGDPRRLEQVLGELCENALKFTEVGSVELRVRSAAGAGKELTLLFTVADTGSGISAGDIGRLFHPFGQLDASTTRRHSGAGMGLALCRELVQLMGGELKVTSTPGAGSVFSFCVAFAVSDVRPEPPLPEEPAVILAAGLRYCCEDTQLYRSQLVQFLERAGATGEIAGALAREEWETAARLAHTLISVSATIGALALSEIARSLEQELLARDSCGIGRLLEKFDLELAQVLRWIRNYVGEERTEPQPEATRPVNAAAAGALLEQMCMLFDRDLDRALGLKELLHGELEGTAAAKTFGRMERLIESFDFEAALKMRGAVEELLGLGGSDDHGRA